MLSRQSGDAPRFRRRLRIAAASLLLAGSLPAGALSVTSSARASGGWAVTPSSGATVGVGMPIIARFAAPVTDRSAVAAELTVHSRPRVIGAWHWFGPQEAVYRPERFWPAHTGVWIEGVTSFHVGASHIAVASAATKEMVVRVNGRVARRIPVSMGKGTSLSTTTTSGVHLVMGKFAQMIFDSASVGCSVGCPGHYRVLVHDAIRITDSGEFVHGAPWDTPVQGHLNVSHGCVDVGPADARWLYAHAQIGDVVEITGTRRHLSPSNGWGFWQIPWRGWLAGTAPLPTRG